MTSRLAWGTGFVLSAAFIAAAGVLRGSPLALWDASTGTFLQAALGLSLAVLLVGEGGWAARLWLGAMAAAVLAGTIDALLLLGLHSWLEHRQLLVAALDGMIWGLASLAGAALAWCGRVGVVPQLAVLALMHSMAALVIGIQYGRQASFAIGEVATRACLAVAVIMTIAGVSAWGKMATQRTAPSRRAARSGRA